MEVREAGADGRAEGGVRVAEHGVGLGSDLVLDETDVKSLA